MITQSGWRGYIFARLIDGQFIPQRVQNLVIRNYCQNVGIQFLLSSVEYLMDDCSMMLSAIYGELDQIEGIVFYSIHLLPRSREKRAELFKIVLSHGCGLRFALEELAILKESDIAMIEDLMMCRELTSGVHHQVHLQTEI